MITRATCTGSGSRRRTSSRLRLTLVSRWSLVVSRLTLVGRLSLVTTDACQWVGSDLLRMRRSYIGFAARCGRGRSASVRKLHRRRLDPRRRRIRRRRSQHLVAQLIAHWRADYPSRSGHRKVSARGAVFRPTAAAPRTRCGSGAFSLPGRRLCRGYDEIHTLV